MVVKRSILITGCSDGSLGARLALAFHEAGWRVFATARDPSKMRQSEAAGIEILQLDILSGESLANSVSRVGELTGGSLDALFNNAGAGHSMPLMDLDIDKARQLFELNTFSVVSVTRAFLPLLLKSTHGGMVVNNTSGSSTIAGALPFAGAYNASKAAAAMFTEGLRLELAPFGIKVINLVTGAVQSTFHENAPHNKLPPTSLYKVAKETIETFMAGETNPNDGSDPVKWAAQVVKSLSSSSPSYWIFAGKYSLAVRLASLLPIGTTDRIIKKMSGLDVVEQKIKEQGGIDRSKLS